ncbi:DUF7260 family protein [Natronorubrum thiooxidans]|uniref:DUF7260 domain-containing protein n=1 Tax=Natronorubrum thiooxidans TaxID=308853 RepID=A0A1N7GN51_9EURY|nr:hypothetical protein [Natronorubrum thiooxidans]SIS14014.1 hypothetical protein SAMN05421752_113120 [Natronorubrum thiooxidans]
MPVETHIDSALSRVERERTHVDEERQAYERFHSGVASLSPKPATAASVNPSTAGGCFSVSGGSQSESTTTDSRRIRELFAETVHKYSVADLDAKESLLETIQEELGDPIAFVLAPGTDAEVTTQIQSAICATTQQRRRELDAMGSALDRERESLQAAANDCQTITEWVVDHNQTSLLELGFPELRRCHEQLSTHRDRCEKRLLARQETIQATTSRDAQLSLKHRLLVRYLYQEFPVSYPILSTLTRLESVLADCQRTVRDHLTRRV